MNFSLFFVLNFIVFFNVKILNVGFALGERMNIIGVCAEDNLNMFL